MLINEKLKHLSEEEVSNLISRYYDNEKVSDLINEYNIDCLNTELVKLFPPEQFKDILCEYCNIPMVRKYQSRSGFGQEEIHCPECLHKLENKNCSCEGCNSKKYRILGSKYLHRGQKEISDLTLKDKVYLATVLRGMEFKEVGSKIVLLPLDSTDKKLAPTREREVEILASLVNKGVISVDINSELNAFDGNLIDNDYGDSFYVAKVRYNLNIQYTRELANPIIDISKENIGQVYDLIREILMDECYEYLEYQMQKVNFDFNRGKTTQEVFEELLDKFSVGQIYGIIYNSVTNATRYYQERSVSKRQAANSVITRCRGYGERAIANGWDIKIFSRPYYCEQSIISSLFFNRIAAFGDKYFTTIYSYDNFNNILNEYMEKNTVN